MDTERQTLAAQRDAEERRLLSIEPALTFVRVAHELASTWHRGSRWQDEDRWRVHVSGGSLGGSGEGTTAEDAGNKALAEMAEQIAKSDRLSDIPGWQEAIGGKDTPAARSHVAKAAKRHETEMLRSYVAHPELSQYPRALVAEIYGAELASREKAAEPAVAAVVA
jgi:hypothetical protein